MAVDHHRIIKDIASQVENTLRHHYANLTLQHHQGKAGEGSAEVLRTSDRTVEVHLPSGQRIRVEVV